MSLKKVFQDKEVVTKFKTTFPLVPIELKGKLVAPPLTDNHAIVGQTFHSLTELKISHTHKKIINDKLRWIDKYEYEKFLATVEQREHLIDRGKTQTYNGQEMYVEIVAQKKSKTIKLGYNGDIIKNRKEFAKIVSKENSNAVINYKKFLKEGLISDSLIKSALYLTRLHLTFNSPHPDNNIGNESEVDIKDIAKLIAVADEHLKAKKVCIINPIFGDYSNTFIGYSEADLILDDTLIDIKVTKELSFTRQHFDQLIYYYILSLIYGVNNDIKGSKPIKNIAIYFARHGVLLKIPINDIADKKTFLEFKDWFMSYAETKTYKKTSR